MVIKMIQMALNIFWCEYLTVLGLILLKVVAS